MHRQGRAPIGQTDFSTTLGIRILPNGHRARQGNRHVPSANRLRLTSFLGDAMAEHDNDGPTLKRQGLYPCEAEIARRLSQSEKHWRRIAPQLERQGLPKIDPIMKGRFWPAVEAFFRNRHGLDNMVALQPDGEERWDVT